MSDLESKSVDELQARQRHLEGESAPLVPPHSIFLQNVHYFFGQTDGTYAWPVGSVGDLLKQAKREIEQLRAVLLDKQLDEKSTANECIDAQPEVATATKRAVCR